MIDLDAALDDLRNIAGGAWNAHLDMHNRIPSQQYTSGTRVTGTNSPTAPRADRQVAAWYGAAQAALEQAYHRSRVFGCAEVWPTSRSTLTPADVVIVCNAIRVVLEDMPVSMFELAAGDLRAAAKKLEPWHRVPVQPRMCSREDCDNLADQGRTVCSRCRKSSYRKRRRERTMMAA